MPPAVPLILLCVSACLLVAGLVWLFGPFGLLGTALVIAALALFGLEVEEPRAEPVQPASWPQQ